MSATSGNAFRELVIEIGQKAEQQAKACLLGSSDREAIYKKANEDILQALRELEAGATIWDFSNERARAVFARDSYLIIRPMTADDADFYGSIRKQYSENYRLMMEAETSVNRNPLAWEVSREQSFFCVIEKSVDRAPIGYLGIKDTREEVWEIDIELDKRYVNQGLGPHSIRLFLREVSRITSKTVFHAMVEPDNIGSQKCFEKLSSKMAIRQCVFPRNPEEQAQYGKEHMNRIDDHTEKVARRLGIDPRKLLTHVLDYTITVSNTGKEQLTL